MDGERIEIARPADTDEPIFNTLSAVKRLRDADIEQERAEVVVDMTHEALSSGVATNKSLLLMEARTRATLATEMSALTWRLIGWVSALLALFSGVVTYAVSRIVAAAVGG